MLKKISYLFMTFTILFSLLVSCNINKYHATLYDDVDHWIKQEFADNNLTSGVYYQNNHTTTNQSFPRSRTFLITTQAEFDEIFNSSAPAVDFTKEILALYTFTCDYVREIKLGDIEIDGLKLEIEYEMVHPLSCQSIGDAVPPYQRYILVKLDKVNVTHVQFERD